MVAATLHHHLAAGTGMSQLKTDVALELTQFCKFAMALEGQGDAAIVFAVQAREFPALRGEKLLFHLVGPVNGFQDSQGFLSFDEPIAQASDLIVPEGK